MATITIQEAQATLPELIHRLLPGEELIIIENDQPVARLMMADQTGQWPCRAGSAKGKIKMADDFDEPLEEFREFME